MVDGEGLIVGAMLATILLVTTMDWPFAAQLAGAFIAVGARVEALCSPGSMLSLSRHPQRLHRYQPLSPDASLRRALAQSQADLVIPCDDLASEIVQRVKGGQNFSDRHDFLTRAASVGARVRKYGKSAGRLAVEARKSPIQAASRINQLRISSSAASHPV